MRLKWNESGGFSLLVRSKGHCDVCAAHLYQYLAGPEQLGWVSARCGARLYLKDQSIPVLVRQLAAQLRLPTGVRHVWNRW